MLGPMGHIEMEARIQKWACGRGHKLDKEVRGRPDDVPGEFAHAAESPNDGALLVLPIVDPEIIMGTGGTNGFHWAEHQVLAPLPVNIKILILEVELRKGLPSIDFNSAVEIPWIDSWIGCEDEKKMSAINVYSP